MKAKHFFSAKNLCNYLEDTSSCQSRGAFVILCFHPWGELFGKSLRLQRLVAELASVKT